MSGRHFCEQIDAAGQLLGLLAVHEGIRPGVLAVSWHYGQLACGSDHVTVGGSSSFYDTFVRVEPA
jgi:hypothetical protein